MKLSGASVVSRTRRRKAAVCRSRRGLVSGKAMRESVAGNPAGPEAFFATRLAGRRTAHTLCVGFDDQGGSGGSEDRRIGQRCADTGGVDGTRAGAGSEIGAARPAVDGAATPAAAGGRPRD